MSLRVSLSEYQAAFQGELFPALEEALGPLPERYGRFVQVLEFVLVDAVVLPSWPGVRAVRRRTGVRWRVSSWRRRCSTCRRRGR